MSRPRKVRRWTAGIDARDSHRVKEALAGARAAGMTKEEYLAAKMAELRAQLGEQK